MKKRYFTAIKAISILILPLIALLLSGCECSVSTANVKDVKICTSLEGNVCNQDNPVIDNSAATIYASCLLKNSVSGTKVKFTWLYYGDTKIKIDDVILDTGELSGNLELNSNLSRPDNGWPKGVYEVEIQVMTDNAKPVIKQFTVN